MSEHSIRRSINIDIGRQVTPLRSVVLQNFHTSEIQKMDSAELVQVQEKLGYGKIYGIWETPEAWMPPGYSRNPGQLKIDFKRLLIAAGALESRIDAAILCLSRYAILLALVPSGQGRAEGGYLKPSTISSMLQNGCIDIIAKAASRTANENEQTSFFGSYRRQDWLALASKSAKKRVEIELGRSLTLHRMGVWHDTPKHFEEALNYPPSNKGADERPSEEEKRNRWQPLPDEYIAEVGWRALWTVRELGPSLLEAGQQIISLLPSLTGMSAERRVHSVNRVLADFDWLDSQGVVISKIPFDLNIRGIGMRDEMTWPPKSGSQIRELLKHLQMAHLWITLMSVGSRIGELLSMQPGAVVHSSDGTPFANGLTFKIVSQIGGAARDWPLPDVAVEALAQQERLADVISKLGALHDETRSSSAVAKSLWLRPGSASEFRGDVNVHLRNAVRSFGLTTEPDGENLSTHRLRKTVARLVALAIAGAPKVLMDLFGHKTIEMTLDYIMSDAEVQAEVKAVVEAQTIMLAENTIHDIDSTGGPASKAIARIVSAEKARLGSEYGAADARELAEVLTMNGRHWALVRPGVICTKLPGGSGPCTTKVGRPEPSRCAWNCDHRLEEAFLKDDVDRAIDEAVQMYDLEVSSDNEIQAEFWAGQLLAHIRRFDDLSLKWSRNPTVASLLGNRVEVTA